MENLWGKKYSFSWHLQGKDWTACSSHRDLQEKIWILGQMLFCHHFLSLQNKVAHSIFEQPKFLRSILEMYKYVPGYKYMYLDMVDHTFPRTQPKKLFHIYFDFFFARRMMLWKYTISTNSFSTLFVGNLQYKIWLIWFKVCKTRSLNICKYAPQCTWWPHFVNNFKYLFLTF